MIQKSKNLIFGVTLLTFSVFRVNFLLLRCTPAGQSGGGDEEGQQGREEAVIGHRQHKPDKESCKTPIKWELLRENACKTNTVLRDHSVILKSAFMTETNVFVCYYHLK